MEDCDNTRERLIEELAQLRRRIARLEVAEADRKRIEEALRESEERYRSFVQNFQGIAYRGKIADWTAIFFHGAVEEITGYSEGDFVRGQPSWLEVIHPDDLPKIAGSADDIRTRPDHATEREYRIVRKDGQIRWIYELAQNACDEAGNPMFVQGALYDITKRKLAEEERERLNRELLEKNKELEQILHVASHDLRSPLVNIQGFNKELQRSLQEVRSVLERDDLSAPVRDKLTPILEREIPESLGYIFTGTSKIDSLLRGLLRLSRLGRAALTVRELDINRLLSDIAGAFEFQITEAKARLEIGELPSCWGDETQVNQVFSNLLDNALKYLDPDRPGVITISGRVEEGQAVYCVEDNGIGIAEEHLGRVNEIFHRLDPEVGQGEGLGLTIARRILERHGGKMRLESERERGSRFFVSLPRSPEGQRRAAE